MKDEIKEIVVDNDELIVKYKDNSFESFDTLPINVLDCITNLQEVNKNLLKKSYSDDVRITKAIEYIKKDWYELNTRDIEHCINLNKDIRIDLLNILQGEDKE